MIKNISIIKLIICNIFLLFTLFQVAIIVINYFVFSPLFCPTSLIELSGLVSVAVCVIVLQFVRPTKCLNVLCLVFIILGIFIGFYYYEIILDSKAIKFDHHIYIKGDQLIEEAKKILKENPEVTEKIYFNGTGRDQKLVWTEKSLRKNKWIVGGLYFSFVVFTGFGIFGLLEIVKRSQLQSVSIETAKNQKTSKKKLEER
jgi:hypothetical protein